MEPAIRSAYDSVRQLDTKPFRSACYAPFVSMYFTTHGTVLACCKNGNFVLGDVRRQRLRDIWRGENTQLLRQALREYRFDRDCAFCEWEISGGNYHSATPRLFDELPVTSPSPEWPAQIEFEGSNTCNFECIMCNGDTSSSIRTSRDGLPPLPRAYHDDFFADLRPFLPHLQRARFFGGEPFLTPESHRIWDMMIEDGLSTPCHVTTNGSQYNARVLRVLDALPFSIVVSIDGATRLTVEKIRVNCRFDQLIENIHRFHAYARRRGTRFNLAFCLMRQNWHEFRDLLLFAEDIGVEVLVNTVVDPAFCSLYTLPRGELATITDSLERHQGDLIERLRLNRNAWTETLLKLRSAVTGGQTAKMSDVLTRYFVPDNPVHRASDLIQDGQYAEALKIAQTVPETDAHYYYALDQRAYSAAMLNDLSGAERDLTRALALSRKRPEAHLNLARTHLKRKRPHAATEEALRAADLAMVEDRCHYQAAELLAFLYVRQGRIGKAIRALKPLSLVQTQDSLLRGFVYPSVGLRPELLREVETNPHNVLSRLIRSTVSALLSARNQLAMRRSHRMARQQNSNEFHATDLRADRGRPERDGRRWLRVAEGNVATVQASPDDPDAIRIAIQKAGTDTSFDIQLNYPNLEAQANHRYCVEFSARADEPRTIFCGFSRGREPWDCLGLYTRIDLNTDWRSVREEFVVIAADRHTRIHFDMGGSDVSVDIRGVTLRDLHDPQPTTGRRT